MVTPRTCTISILIIASTVISGSLWAEAPKQPITSLESPENTIERFQNLQRTARAFWDSKATCASLDDARFPEKCEFKDFCGILEQNGEKPYLYVNSDGQGIPNFHVQPQLMQAGMCYSMKKNAPPPGESPQDYTKKIMKENYLRLKRAELSLFKTAKRLGKEKELLAYQMASTRMAISETRKDETKQIDWREGINVQKIDEQIAATEKSARVKLPKELREALKQHIVLTLTNGGNPSAFTDQISEFKNFSSKSPFFEPQLMEDSKLAGSVEQAKAYQVQYQKELDRAHQIFEDTRAAIVRRLEAQKKSDPAHAASLDQLIIRIQTVKHDHSNKLTMYCSGPNAFYMASSHSFTLCPGILQLPTASLTAIIAHELGHAIDPCIASGTLVSGNAPAVAQHEIHGLPWDPPKDVPLTIRLPDQGSTSYHVVLPGQGAGGMGVKPAAESIALVDNPFRNGVISCLSQSSSLNARVSDRQGAKSNLENYIKEMERQGTPADDLTLLRLKETLKNFDATFDKAGACSILPGNSQQQEAFSDWLAAEVVGERIKSIPMAEQKKYAFESFGFFLGTSCRRSPSKVETEIKDLRRALRCEDRGAADVDDLSIISAVSRFSKDEHSFSTERITKMFLANPAVSEAMKCSPKDEVVHCE